ncbi:ferrous iron transport protein A [Acidipropionibacterium jensenii]|uniref:Ferrous iron transport protein A n=1 Tax=Acidipropionibacterium jensenii TaxID=1749 RepID=A0A3Q9UK59_9ACTN|nr:FeoA family protein [Acidipropionibacterium jensenii]AZZ39032.1 ferrous iron transport protein A [Acidipropionibacterium jensenii]
MSENPSRRLNGDADGLRQSLRGEPLSSCLTGVPRVLQATGARPEIARRLAALGLRRGAQVTLMTRTAGRGGIVSVAGARIALDHSMLASLYTTDARDAA